MVVEAREDVLVVLGTITGVGVFLGPVALKNL